MSDEEMRIAIAEACGWVATRRGRYFGRVVWWFRKDSREVSPTQLPDYLTDRNAIHAALLHHGIQSHNNPAIRVKFIGHLREIAGRRLPRNKSGASLMCDVDLVTCEAWELCEALLKTLKLWKS